MILINHLYSGVYMELIIWNTLCENLSMYQIFLISMSTQNIAGQNGGFIVVTFKSSLVTSVGHCIYSIRALETPQK